MNRLHTHADFLRALKEATPDQRAHMCYHSNPNQQKALAEIIYNALCGNCNLSSKDINDLRPHQQRLKKLASPQVGPQSRNKMVRYQKGGWLGSVLGKIFKTTSRKAGRLAKKAVAIAKNKGLQKQLLNKTKTRGKKLLKTAVDNLSQTTSQALDSEPSGLDPQPESIEQLYNRLHQIRLKKAALLSGDV